MTQATAAEGGTPQPQPYDPDEARRLYQHADMLKQQAAELKEEADRAMEDAVRYMVLHTDDGTGTWYDDDLDATVEAKVTSSRLVRWNDKAMWDQYGATYPDLFTVKVNNKAVEQFGKTSPFVLRQMSQWAEVTTSKPRVTVKTRKEDDQ